jgi:hypothetical protein
MKRGRFVVSKSVRLPLSDGDWIEVRNKLTVGEARLATSSFVGSYRPDGSRTPNLETLGMGLVFAYLLDWSFRDENDKPVKVSLDALKNLDLETYNEVDKAINAHVEAVEADEAEREKKIPESGENAA